MKSHQVLSFLSEPAPAPNDDTAMVDETKTKITVLSGDEEEEGFLFLFSEEKIVFIKKPFRGIYI